MKILFCTDGSKISYSAIENFSKWNKSAMVDIICVIDWSFLPEEVYIEEAGFANSCSDIAKGIIESTECKIKELGLEVNQSIKQCGNAADCIIEQLKKENYDLVIMGSHGKKGIQKWLGSVSREIISNTPVSGYISKEINSAEKILFTTDGSRQAVHAIKFVSENFDLTDKEIYLCTVNEDPDLLFLEGNLDTNWLLAIQKRQKLFALKTIREAENIIEHDDVIVANKAVLSGTPAQKIIDYTTREGIDLIVLGGKHKSKMESFLLGSVSKRVLDNVKCDIMIIKYPESNIAQDTSNNPEL